MTISFHGETAGSVAERKTNATGSETTGAIGARIREKDPEVQLQVLDKDTVSFHGQEDGKKNSGSGFLGTLFGIAAIGIAAVAGLGIAKKYGAFEKLGEGKFKDFVTKYAADPSYQACSKVKEWGKGAWDAIVNVFKKK